MNLYVETTVLLVGSKESFFLNSVARELESKGSDILYSYGNIDEISHIARKIDGIIIYADEETIENNQLIVYIRDKAEEFSIPIFLMGYEENVDVIMPMLPDYLVKEKFYRPINANMAAEHVYNFMCNRHNLKRELILVVDDSAQDLRAMKDLLENDYQVILAQSGAMAIKYLAQNHPDLILLDYEMPIVNGCQVLQMIRAEDEYKDTPVIFLTAKGDMDSILRVMPFHPEGYLLKTMDGKQVLNAINEFFEKKNETRSV